MYDSVENIDGLKRIYTVREHVPDITKEEREQVEREAIISIMKTMERQKLEKIQKI